MKLNVYELTSEPMELYPGNWYGGCPEPPEYGCLWGIVATTSRSRAKMLLLKELAPELYRDVCRDMREMPKFTVATIFKNVRLHEQVWDGLSDCRLGKLFNLAYGLNEHGEPDEEFWPELGAELEAIRAQ